MALLVQPEWAVVILFPTGKAMMGMRAALCLCIASASAWAESPRQVASPSQFDPSVNYEHMVRVAFGCGFPIRLLLHDHLVLEDLAVTAVQQSQLAELDGRYVQSMAEFRKAYTPARGKEAELSKKQGEMQAVRTKMIQRTEAAAYNILDLRQRRRLGEICVQMAGASAFDIDVVQEALGISKVQLSKIHVKRKELFKLYEKTVTPADVKAMTFEEYEKLDLLEQLTFNECMQLLDERQRDMVVAMRGETCMFRPPHLKRRISYGTTQRSVAAGTKE